jgi:hypothetical protein
MASGKFVAYYRVSTDGQGKSGLGLEAQGKAVNDYLNGGSWNLVGNSPRLSQGATPTGRSFKKRWLCVGHTEPRSL